MNANPVETERRQVRYSGRVQGVGFRYTTRHIAGRFDVCGYVRNLANGQVELVVEGRPRVLDEFLAALAIEMDRCIEQTTIESAPATGEFAQFDVRH